MSVSCRCPTSGNNAFAAAAAARPIGQPLDTLRLAQGADSGCRLNDGSLSLSKRTHTQGTGSAVGPALLARMAKKRALRDASGGIA